MTEAELFRAYGLGIPANGPAGPLSAADVRVRVISRLGTVNGPPPGVRGLAGQVSQPGAMDRPGLITAVGSKAVPVARSANPSAIPTRVREIVG